MLDIIQLTLREQTQPAFTLKQSQEVEPFALKDATYDDILIVKAPSLTGITSLKGPRGDAGPQLKGLSVFCSGQPASLEVIGGGLAPYDFTINVDNCIAKAKVAATGNTIFSIRDSDNLEIGTILFNSGSYDGIVVITSPNISSGDYITFHSPSNSDATLADIGIIIKE